MKTTDQTLDMLTRTHTAAETFGELVGTADGSDYFPTLTGKGTIAVLASAYDKAMAERGDDPRRAWRGSRA